MRDKAVGQKPPEQDKVSKVNEIKANLSAQIENIEKYINVIIKVTQASIQQIELKKTELREFKCNPEICQEKQGMEREIKIQEKDIEGRKISFALLDETLANFDKQISEIQAEHDKAAAELNLNKRKLYKELAYYEALNQRLNDLLDLLQKENKDHEDKLNQMLVQKAELQKRTDLSEDEIKILTEKLNAQVGELNKKHEEIMNFNNKKLCDIKIRQPILLIQYAVGPETGSNLNQDVAGPETGSNLIQDMARPETCPDFKQDVAGPETGSDLKQDVAGPETGSDLKQDIAGSETGPDFKQDVVGPKTGSDLKQDVAGPETGSDLKQDIAGSETGPDFKQDLVGPETGSDLKQDVAGPETGSDFKQDVAGPETGSDFKQDVVGPETGSDLKQDVAGPETGSDFKQDVAGPEIGPDFKQDVARSETGSDFKQDVAGPETGSDLKQDIAGPETGPDFKQDVTGPEPGSDLKQDIAGPDTGTDFKQDVAGPETGSDLKQDIAGPDTGTYFKQDVAGPETGSYFKSVVAGDETASTKLQERQETLSTLGHISQGHKITTSGTIIIHKDDVISLQQANLLGLMVRVETSEEEEEIPDSQPESYPSTESSILSSIKSTSVETELDYRDVEYLKEVFGKSVSLALAEMIELQPMDPIHYLAHWFFKYRYNQEIDEAKRQHIKELIVKRKKFEAERWHRELMEEAYLAVLEAVFRAERIIMHREYLMDGQETEGEYDQDSVHIMEFLNV